MIVNLGQSDPVRLGQASGRMFGSDGDIVSDWGHALPSVGVLGRARCAPGRPDARHLDG